MNQNAFFGVGRVASKPQLKPYKNAKGEDGYRCFFRLAITRLMDRGVERDKQRTNFIPVVAWGEQAKRHAQYLDVGTEVTVMGELTVDQIREADGSLKRRTDGSVIEYINISARDVQYGQPSLKNATPEQLERRGNAIQTRLSEIQNLVAGASGAPSETPVSTPATGGNPFTPDGQAPAPAE